LQRWEADFNIFDLDGRSATAGPKGWMLPSLRNPMAGGAVPQLHIYVFRNFIPNGGGFT